MNRVGRTCRSALPRAPFRGLVRECLRGILSMNRRVRARGLLCVGRVPRPGGAWSECAPNLVWAFHEPTCSLAERGRPGCTGRRLADRKDTVHRHECSAGRRTPQARGPRSPSPRRFMAPIRVQSLEVVPPHEPTHSYTPPRRGTCNCRTKRVSPPGRGKGWVQGFRARNFLSGSSHP